ncbi:hypothetical protein OG21DRAFT_1499702 [Imleria badia]|nr:hypothetical protein OG21DRAFT_1499702 [Imleria badia]
MLAPSIIPTLEDPSNFGAGGDGTKPWKPVQPPSPECPTTKRHGVEGVETRTTSKSRRLTHTIASSQKDRERDTDPDQGRCFITNRPTPLRLYHLVSQATDRETITRLEYVWELGHRQFDLDAKHNVLHLRADWLILFDDSRWILVPEVKIIQDLKKIYLTDKHPTSNLPMQFENQTFNYYVVPAPSLREPICRFPDVDGDAHKTHVPPYSELGPLTSHIHPYYVIFNSGRKIGHFKYGELLKMRRFLSQNASMTVGDAMSTLVSMFDLYVSWIKAKVPTQWRKHYTPSNPPHPPGGEGRDDPSQGGQSSGSISVGLPFHPPEDDDSSSESVTDDTVEEDDTAWIEYIQNWQKQVDSGCGTAERWALGVLNDSYVDEHARTPPPPGSWDSWKPAWDDNHEAYPSASERSELSSNDWAVFKKDVYLTRRYL